MIFVIIKLRTYIDDTDVDDGLLPVELARLHEPRPGLLGERAESVENSSSKAKFYTCSAQTMAAEPAGAALYWYIWVSCIRNQNSKIPSKLGAETFTGTSYELVQERVLKAVMYCIVDPDWQAQPHAKLTPESSDRYPHVLYLVSNNTVGCWL
jgi:hypothetical protein